MTYKATKLIQELRNRTEREFRTIPIDAGSIELRSAADGLPPRIRMFIPYNRRSEDLGGYYEVIAPGAFARSLKNAQAGKRSDVVALWNHDPSWVLGRQSNGTLAIDDTPTGLEGIVSLDAEDPMHRHFARRVERRDVQGASFAFRKVKDGTDYKVEGGDVIATLKEVKIDDLSPVTYPAYPASGAQRRSVEIAAVRMGMDVDDLAALIAGAEGGKVAQEAAAEVRSWVAKLTGLIPEPPVPVVDWKAKLALRERALRSMANV